MPEEFGKSEIWKVSDSVSLDSNCPSSELREVK